VEFKVVSVSKKAFAAVFEAHLYDIKEFRVVRQLHTCEPIENF
jgi:hypothetical protein